MRKALNGMMLTIALCLSAAGAVHSADADAAKYRQSIMKALSGHNGAIRLIVAGKAGDPEKLAGHIDALATLAEEDGALFPAGSDLEDDEALPVIWEDPERFAEALARLESAVRALQGAAGGAMEQIEAAYGELDKSCKGCHEEFRLDD